MEHFYFRLQQCPSHYKSKVSHRSLWWVSSPLPVSHVHPAQTSSPTRVHSTCIFPISLQKPVSNHNSRSLFLFSRQCSIDNRNVKLFHCHIFLNKMENFIFLIDSWVDPLWEENAMYKTIFHWSRVFLALSAPEVERRRLNQVEEEHWLLSLH